MDQGGQERHQMDEVFLPDIQGQPDPLTVVRVGLQSGQLPAAAGGSQEHPSMDAYDIAGEAHQDRCEGYSALEVRHIPTGRGRGDARFVRSDPRPYRAVGNPAATGGQSACVASPNRGRTWANWRQICPRAAANSCTLPCGGG